MTISSQTSRIEYTGNGATTAFSVPFYFAANSDIKVYVRTTAGVSTLQVSGTHYNLTGATLSAGGTCTFLVAPTSGYHVIIFRDPELTQTTSYNNNDPFPASSHERALDKACTIDQRTRDLATRAIYQDDGDSAATLTIPTLESRKGKLAGYDATDGSLTTSATTMAALDTALALAGASSITTTRGDLIFRNATTNARLGAGTTGQVLQTNGTSADPSWVTLPGTNFVQAGTGAVTRTQQNKSRDLFNVKDFGAVGDGTTDDTAAFVAALAAATAAGGGRVDIPAGTFKVISTLSVVDNVALVGAGSDMTTLTTTSTTAGIISMTGLYPQLRGMSLTSSGTPTNGSMVAVTGTGTFSYIIDDVHIMKCWNGFVFTGTSNAARMSIGFVSNIRVYNFQSIGINCKWVNDIFFTHFLIYQKDIGFNVGTYGIDLEENCEAIVMTAGDVVGGAYSLRMFGTTPTTHGTRPAFNSFHGVYFDSAANGSIIEASAETTFVNCWFSTGGLGGVTTASGLTINACDTLLFTNCRWFTNAKDGCTINSGAHRVGFVNCSFTDNCVLASSGTGHGLIIANTADKISVIGGFAKNGEYPGLQGYGIAVGTGVTNLTITGVDVNNNVTGGISIGTALSASVTVTDCKGFVSMTRAVGTVLSGGTSLAVAHGLSGTPTTVICTLLDNGTGAQAVGTNLPRVLTVGATNFTFDIGVVATANRPFSWEARL